MTSRHATFEPGLFSWWTDGRKQTIYLYLHLFPKLVRNYVPWPVRTSLNVEFYFQTSVEFHVLITMLPNAAYCRPDVTNSLFGQFLTSCIANVIRWIKYYVLTIAGPLYFIQAK
jgi:hypothetical protein